MKKRIFLLVAIIVSFATIQASAQGCCARHAEQTTQTTNAIDKSLTTESFVVKGNCISCKAKIEKAANIRGVQSAVWDVQTHMLTVQFDAAKTTVDKINRAVVQGTGYETSFAVQNNTQTSGKQGCATQKSGAACATKQ
jgi:outer membrane receptor for ferrienterochelin and colicins